MGVIVSHEFNGMSCGDIVKFHEVCHFWVGLDFLSSLRVLSPGAVPRWSSSSSLPGVSSMLRRVASLFMADEAFAISDVLCSVAWREIDLIYVHSVWVDL